jgi:ribosomal protein S18 acetylase RimI-like enzyme
MRLTIRKAGAGEVDAIVAFGAAVVPQHYTPILGAEAAQAQLGWWTPERLAPAVVAGRIQVALADDDVVGVCETGELAGHQVVWKLYLAPEFRGRSLGVDLLRHAIASLPDEVDHVDVEHFAGNTSAARFYEREGFEVIATDPTPGGEPSERDIVWRRLRLA